MTVRNDMMNDGLDENSADYVIHERRRILTTGVAIAIAALLATLAIFYFFGATATTPW